MHKGRMEAFSDGVIAIIITIMVLDLKVPHKPEIAAVAELLPTFLSYVLSFVFVGIYWNNHHHMMQAVQKVSGPSLWANMHLLFWLSLIPFVSGWMGENHFAAAPAALYGFVLLMCALAYYILARTLIAIHEQDSLLVSAIGSDMKERLSLGIYLLAIPLAFVHPAFAYALYVIVALMWLIPDRRIEKAMDKR